MCAGQRPLCGPDLSSVELGDEGEEAVRGGMDVGGERGDGGGESVVVDAWRNRPQGEERK